MEASRILRENWLERLNQAIEFAHGRALKAGRVSPEERRKYLHCLGYLVQVSNKVLTDGEMPNQRVDLQAISEKLKSLMLLPGESDDLR